MTDVCIITPKLSDNSLGRTYCIWLLTQAAGLTSRTISVCPDTPVWSPLRDTEFGDSCESLDIRSGSNRAAVKQALQDARLTIVIKAIPDSFGRVYRYIRDQENVIVDIDDPDVEAATIWLPPRARIRAMMAPHYWRLRLGSHRIDPFPKMVSNPTLQEMYGGTLIPHVRYDDGPGPVHTSTSPRVAFVGTPKVHKGIEVLREAVAGAADLGFTLEVTAPPPSDAQPWEHWRGATSFAEGLQIAASADIVAVPSLDEGYARAQFPVKIVDGLLAARPIVASDLGPVRWAIGPGGTLCPAGDAVELRRALVDLQDPERRNEIGALGRARGLGSFTVDAVLPEFLRVVEQRLR